MPPDEDAIEGGEVFHFWRHAVEAGIAELRLETTSIEECGAFAIELGQYALQKDEQTRNRGKYLAVWKHEEDGWRLYRQIWNRNLHPTAPMKNST